MVRVYVWVEGQTEEAFVNSVLQPDLNRSEIFLYPRLIGKSGGIGRYQRDKRDFLITLKQDAAAFCTTMIDYYGMPEDWPGREAARLEPFADKAQTVEQAVLESIAAELSAGFDRSHFIPYVQMHEFEALLFSMPEQLAAELESVDESDIQRIRDQFRSPEEINDGQQTAPSKRIMRLSPGYSKVVDGIRIAQKIGLPTMRAECSHFDEWVSKLESLANR